MKLRLIVATVVALLSGSGVNPVAHPALAASRCVGGPGCYATTPLALNAAHDGDAIQIGKGTVAGSAIITKSAASTLTRRLMLPAVVSLVALGSTRPAVASALPLLPHRPQIILYPVGTKVQVTDPLSNFDKSCLWNLDCIQGGTPRTHTEDEDALGRVGGWTSFAEWDGKHRQQMTFTLFGSAYGTPAQAAAAAMDFNAQLTGKGFEMSPFPCLAFVTGTDVRQYCARYHEHSGIGGHYFSLAASEGTLEIELLTHANTRYQAFKRVTFALAQAAMSE